MAEYEPVQQSMLSFYFQGMGLFYTAALLLSAAVSLVLVVLILWRGTGPLASAALMLSTTLPLLTGLLGTVSGAISANQVIASSVAAPQPSVVALGITSALTTLHVGLWLTIPVLLLALAGSLFRALFSRPSAA